jgi:hypothetical protein
MQHKELRINHIPFRAIKQNLPQGVFALFPSEKGMLFWFMGASRR